MSIGDAPIDPRWHRLLGLAVHEIRTPVTVVSGYIRMLLTSRAGEISEPQRRMLEEAEKSCGKLSGLLVQMSDLASLESGEAKFSRGTLDVGAVLEDAIASLPPLNDGREIAVRLLNDAPGAKTVGDAARLKGAFGSVLQALRRELITSTELLVRLRRATMEGRQVVSIAIAEEDGLDALSAAAPASLSTFDEWRGGSGLRLAIARRVLTAHEGRIWAPAPEARAAAVLVLPEA